jgi:prophage DNA circulation protein
MEDVLAEVVVQTAIDPVAEFVEQTSYTEEGEAVTESVRNPVIVQDEQERAKAVEILETYNDR